MGDCSERRCEVRKHIVGQVCRTWGDSVDRNRMPNTESNTEYPSPIHRPLPHPHRRRRMMRRAEHRSSITLKAGAWSDIVRRRRALLLALLLGRVGRGLRVGRRGRRALGLGRGRGRLLIRTWAPVRMYTAHGMLESSFPSGTKRLSSPLPPIHWLNWRQPTWWIPWEPTSMRPT